MQNNIQSSSGAVPQHQEQELLQVPSAPKLRAQQAPLDFHSSFNVQLLNNEQLSNGNCNTALCSASNCSVSEGLSQNGNNILELQKEALSQGSYNMQGNNSWNNNMVPTSQSVSLPQVESILPVDLTSDQIGSMSMH